MRQISLPLRASIDNTSSLSFFTPSTDVRKIRPSRTTGVDWPKPGVVIFQAGLCRSDKDNGRVAAECESPLPRKPVHEPEGSAAMIGIPASRKLSKYRDSVLI